MTCEFTLKTFDKLTSVDIYHILKARSQVFVVEQNCPYQDMDEVDFDCLHLVAHQNETLVGYCRIIPPEYNKKSTASHPASQMASIGRVLVLAPYRGDGIARELMTQAISYCRKNFGKKRPIILSAQTYLLAFYQSLGFIAEGEAYFEDGIEHVIMVLSPLKKAKTQNDSSWVATTLTLLFIILGLLFIAGLIYLMT